MAVYVALLHSHSILQGLAHQRMNSGTQPQPPPAAGQPPPACSPGAWPSPVSTPLPSASYALPALSGQQQQPQQQQRQGRAVVTTTTAHAPSRARKDDKLSGRSRGRSLPSRPQPRITAMATPTCAAEMTGSQLEDSISQGAALVASTRLAAEAAAHAAWQYGATNGSPLPFANTQQQEQQQQGAGGKAALHSEGRGRLWWQAGQENQAMDCGVPGAGTGVQVRAAGTGVPLHWKKALHMS